LFAAGPVKASGQTPPPQELQMGFKTALVLTPEFCATVTKKGTWGVNEEKFPIGKAVCDQLEPALRTVFYRLSRVSEESSAGDSDLVLVPRLVDVGATQKAFAFSKRELVIMIEWTAKDKAGKTVWIDTIQGSAKHNIGNAFTYKNDLKLIVADASKNVADESAKKMSLSPEIHKVAQ
jgi:hypothetical protein